MINVQGPLLLHTIISVSDDTSVLILMAFGIDHVVNAVTCVARGNNLPALVYLTTYHRKPVRISTTVFLT